MNLCIYDVSAVVHTAVSAASSAPTTWCGYPIDGIKSMLRYIAIDFARGNEVLLCFDSPTDKAEYLPSYKQGRPYNVIVGSQIDALREDLFTANVNCLKVDNLEADDIIHAAAMANKDRYEEINIFGNDYDLCHSVQANVIFRGVNSNVHMVNQSIFNTNVERGVWLRFNTLSAYKSMCGCTSDKVPALSLNNGLSGDKLYRAFLDYCDENNFSTAYAVTSDIKLFLHFVVNSGLFTEEEAKRAYVNALIVYPREIPDGSDLDMTPTSFRSVNKEWLASMFSKYGLYSLGKDVLNLKVDRTSEEHKKELYEKSKALATGTFAASKNVPADTETNTYSRIAGTAMELDAFDDDF